MARKAKGKERLIEYLSERVNTYVFREDIIKDIGISNSRLSELIDELIADGYELEKLSGKAEKLQGKGKVKLVGTTSIAQDIDDEDVRMWLILLALSRKNDMRFVDIIVQLARYADSIYMDSINLDKKKTSSVEKFMEYLEVDSNLYECMKDSFSINTLQKDLATLRSEGYVDKKEDKYLPTVGAPSMLQLSDNEMDAFVSFLDSFKESIAQTATLRELLSKAMTLYRWESLDGSTRLFGKENKIDEAQLECLKTFAQYPYKSKSLRIRHKSDEKEMIVDTALLYYSIETHCFYGLFVDACDENVDLHDGIEGERDVRQSRLDAISSIEIYDKPNEIYGSKKYKDIYRQMFGAEYGDERVHVKVLFEDIGSVKERLVDLYCKRASDGRARHDYIEDIDTRYKKMCDDSRRCGGKKSKNGGYPLLYEDHSYAPDIPHYIVYEDEIRGMGKFERFIRSFGSSALVLEPRDMRDRLIASSKEILKHYEEGSDEKR